MLTKVSRPLRHRLTGALALAAATLPLAACGSGSSSAGAKASSQISSAISSAASQAGSAASQAGSAASQAGSAASQAGSAASQALSSASSAASSAIGQISGGVTATSDVSPGPVTIDSDGRAVSQLTVTNPTADTHDYTISITFDDSNGKAQDVTVLTVSQVPGHGSATATARSNRTLSGSLTAKVTAAVRH